MLPQNLQKGEQKLSENEENLSPLEKAQRKLRDVGLLPQTDDEEVDIDQSQDTENALSYQDQLKEYFQEVEEQYGIEVANQIRAKIVGDKQLEYYLDLYQWSKELHEMQLETIAILKGQNKQLIEDVQGQVAQNRRIADRLFKASMELHERVLKSIDESDERDRKLDGYVREIMELKKKKWARENE